MEEVRILAEKVKSVAKKINCATSKMREAALKNMAKELRKRAEFILKENEKDLENAKKKGVSDALYDRLKLTEERIFDMACAIEKVSELPEVLGETLETINRPNGLKILKKSVPIGVVGIIYEARPNVTADAAALCIKTGNATILRGGKEAINSKIAITDTLQNAIEPYFPREVISLVENTDRESANALMRQSGLVDVLIPRGGAGLIKSVVENATVPVIETGVGNCHIFVDESAKVEMALEIIKNAKLQRPGVCNAAESLLVHEKIAKTFVPEICKILSDAGVKIYGCGKTMALADVLPATDEEFAKEFLGPEISVKIVKDVNEAIEHIDKFSTGHSECIVTENRENAELFLYSIDSAAVYVNASTRFTDGGEFGFGAEIGISTQKLHARGPMGQKALTTSKYVIYGEGQIR